MTSRYRSASNGTTWRQHHQFCGQPCSSTTGGASAGPASATWTRSPATSTKVCSTPSSSGIAGVPARVLLGGVLWVWWCCWVRCWLRRPRCTPCQPPALSAAQPKARMSKIAATARPTTSSATGRRRLTNAMAAYQSGQTGKSFGGSAGRGRHVRPGTAPAARSRTSPATPATAARRRRRPRVSDVEPDHHPEREHPGAALAEQHRQGVRPAGAS